MDSASVQTGDLAPKDDHSIKRTTPEGFKHTAEEGVTAAAQQPAALTPIKLDMFYDRDNAVASAFELLQVIRPNWKTTPGDVKIAPLLGGVPNTLLKITKQAPDKTPFQNDQAAIILRVYGSEPKVLVNRELEAQTHEMLAERGLASPLYARFRNGLVYAYLPGRPCQLQELPEEEIWSCVATKLGEFHAKMPFEEGGLDDTTGHNIWSSMQRWVESLPSTTAEETIRRQELQDELAWSFGELSKSRGASEPQYVFGHCDLLCGNIIIAKQADDKPGEELRITPDQIRFIDYEFAMSCPAAFDIANHFSEWCGFDCDYNLLPGRAVRERFIAQYLASYRRHANIGTPDFETAVTALSREVDRFRGIPGLWWAIHGFVSVLESKVKFDWIPYANKRLAEYRAWKAEFEGSRVEEGGEMALREELWARE